MLKKHWFYKQNVKMQNGHVFDWSRFDTISPRFHFSAHVFIFHSSGLFVLLTISFSSVMNSFAYVSKFQFRNDLATVGASRLYVFLVSGVAVLRVSSFWRRGSRFLASGVLNTLGALAHTTT